MTFLKKNTFIFFVLSVTLALSSSLAGAQCEYTLSSGPAAWDYFVRLAMHFGDASSIPNSIICSRSLAEGEDVVQVPIWAYNLHEGIDYLEFAVESNESLGVFIPDNCFTVVSSNAFGTSSGFHLDLVLQACAPVCGPARVGLVEVVRTRGLDPVWVDFAANSLMGRMVARDVSGNYHYAFSPSHGCYLGNGYLYNCQPPLCEEPNSPVSWFDARPGGNCRVKLMWTAGGGNWTMIRWSIHRYPVGIEDGHLAAERETVPGQSYYLYHVEIPTPARIFYTAFSYTRDASGNIVRDSFVECSSVDYIDIKCEIATEESSWGAIKSLYR